MHTLQKGPLLGSSSVDGAGRPERFSPPPPLCYKVLLSITNIYAPIWSKDVVQEILGSSCKVFETTLTSATGEDLSSFMVVAWTMHPDLIPTEMGCVVPEPEGPSEVGQRPLFLRVGELILSNYIVMTY
jgi:hypothetical protein